VENDHDAALASSSSPVVAAASSSPKDNVTSNGRPQRHRRQPDRWLNAMNAYLALEEDGSDDASLSDVAYTMHAPPSSPDDDPISYADAMSRPDASAWKAAMDAEMASHARNGTWVVVEAPVHRRPIGNKWALRTKRRADGSVEKLKARLVGKGFTQQYGVDYLNTWSPTVRIKTIRFVFALATRWDMELQQMDVETAFLNAPMKEEVYMSLPEGYEQQLTMQATQNIVSSEGMHEKGDVSHGGAPSPSSNITPNVTQPDRPALVCRLVKCLYGTKQASMEWNAEVNRTLTTKLGFQPTMCDPCLYHRITRTGHIMLLCLFVDDIVIAYFHCDAAEWRQLKSIFMSTYSCKDQGDAYSLLGMRIVRDRTSQTMHIDQTAYIDQLLTSLSMDACKPASTPAKPNTSLTEMTLKAIDDHCPSSSILTPSQRQQYQSIVGSLQYLAQVTRFDIAHAVNQCAAFLSEARRLHWDAVMWIIRYCKGEREKALVYRCGKAGDDDKKGVVHDGGETASTSSNSISNIHPHPSNTMSSSCHDPIILSAWSDADWAGCGMTRRSTTCYVVQAWGCVISW